MSKTYTIYMISNTKNNKVYIGLTTSPNNMMYWLLKKNKENGSYKSLAESVKQDGISCHTYHRTNKVFDNKDDGEQALRNYQLKLHEKGLLINDVIVETEKYTCQHCNKTLKVCYKDKHEELYCSKRANEVLDSLC